MNWKWKVDASEGAPKKLAKPEELVKLYDNLLQNMTDLSQLIDKEDLESVKETAARTLTFKAFRFVFFI